MALRNLDRVLARIARIPRAVREAVDHQLDREADGLVAAMKADAPVGDGDEGHPGRLRESIRKEPGRRELQRRIIADAKNDKGVGYATYAEFGHRAENGERVPARPFFFVNYRGRRAGIRRHMRKAGRDAVKRLTE